LWLLTLPVLQAQPAPSLEYRVKAAFLFNFAQFVDWPATTFPLADSPLIIGILGDDPFGTYLDETVAGEAVAGHPLVVQRYRNHTDLRPCHILFVHARYPGRIADLYRTVPVTGLLTVGDSPDFLGQGGMIRFYRKAGKVRLQINPEVARAAGLTISSKLLRIADIYVP